MMADSIFTKIIKGEIPAEKVYEDNDIFAFLTIEPLNPGHVLAVPKKQVDHLWDLEDDLYKKLMLASKEIALRIRKVIGPPRVGMAVEGFGVPHVHIHIFPLYKAFEATIGDFENKENRVADRAELAKMAKKLAF